MNNNNNLFLSNYVKLRVPAFHLSVRQIINTNIKIRLTIYKFLNVIMNVFEIVKNIYTKLEKN